MNLSEFIRTESGNKTLNVISLNCTNEFSKFIGKKLECTNSKLISEVTSENELEQTIISSTPDLAIINIELNEHFNGYELAKIFKITYDIPFYILLANDSLELVQWTQELNPDGIEFMTPPKLHTAA